MRYCSCGKVKLFRNGTVEHFIHDLKIKIHNEPHFYCDYCDTVSYGDGTDITLLIKQAFKLRISELDYNDRNNTTIVFQFDTVKELKYAIQTVINQNIDNLHDEESFAIVIGGTIIVGQRLSNFIAVEKMINKVL